MKNRIRRCPPYLFKRFSTPAEAEAAVSRSALLHKAGVQTAKAATNFGSRLVRFDLIEAETGFAVLLRQGKSVLPTLMQNLVALHVVKGLADLQPFQPLMKITPRLSEAHHQAFAPLVSQALGEISDLPGETCVIHGDLHVGQFLIDASGTCWLIDFDDVAIGDPAADLGNFAAHLATRPETCSGPPFAAMRQWLAMVLDAYHRVGGHTSAQAADAYGRLALVRRVLKLQQTRSDEFADQLLIGLQEAP
jgi:streptomycin 6-kinase